LDEDVLGSSSVFETSRLKGPSLSPEGGKRTRLRNYFSKINMEIFQKFLPKDVKENDYKPLHLKIFNVSTDSVYSSE
jgi:hypothetical protein